MRIGTLLLAAALLSAQLGGAAAQTSFINMGSVCATQIATITGGTASPNTCPTAMAALSTAPLTSGQKRIENIGTGVAVALPLIAGGIAVYQDDWHGVGQLILDTGATVGTAYLLKHVVRERRPDKSDYQSFPSDTAALAFAPAQFLWDRYGWEYGLPAYAAATFVGYSRIDAKQHHWYDVVASAGFAFGFSKLFTSRYRARGLTYGASLGPDGSAYASLDYKF